MDEGERTQIPFSAIPTKQQKHKKAKRYNFYFLQKVFFAEKVKS
jgi:hypothetical protein